jgi:hypothetical protein
MTPQERKVMELALEALQDYVDEYGPWSDDSGAQYVLRVIKEALAQPEQSTTCVEPVAVVNGLYANRIEWKCAPKSFPADGTNLYTIPPAQRKPLTDEQIEALLVNWPEDGIAFFEFARAIEAAHGIKE